MPEQFIFQTRPQTRKPQSTPKTVFMRFDDLRAFHQFPDLRGQDFASEQAAPTENIAHTFSPGIFYPRINARVRERSTRDEVVAALFKKLAELQERVISFFGRWIHENFSRANSATGSFDQFNFRRRKFVKLINQFVELPVE